MYVFLFDKRTLSLVTTLSLVAAFLLFLGGLLTGLYLDLPLPTTTTQPASSAPAPSIPPAAPPSAPPEPKPTETAPAEPAAIEAAPAVARAVLAPPPTPAALPGRFAVQVAAFGREEAALAEARALGQAGLDASVLRGEDAARRPVFRVVLGSFVERQAALQLAQRVSREHGRDAFVRPLLD